MGRKELYAQFYAQLDNPSVFLAPWYLDANADNWSASFSYSGNDINGAVVYEIRKKKTLTFIQSIPFTPAVNILYSINKDKSPYNANKELRKILQNIFSDLPQYDSFRVKLGKHIIDWRPIYWLGGFSQTTRYTSFIDKSNNIEELRTRYKSSLRTQIRKAENNLELSKDRNKELIYSLIESTYDRKKDKMSFNKKQFFKWYDAVSERGILKTWTSLYEGKTIGGILCIQDHDCLYYIFGGFLPEHKKLASQSYLMDNAIAYSLENGLSFDFEGSMIEGVDGFFMTYNPEIQPYHEIYHMNNKLLNVRNLLK